MNDKQIYGGQAGIEGVMMRGKKYVACAVRDPHGNIVTTTEPLSPAIYASRWAKIPFLRAVTILWDTLVLGTKMLMYSANIAVEEEAKKNAETTSNTSNAARASSDPPQAISTGMALGTVLIALAFGIGLFFVLPLALVNIADPYLNASFASENVASFVSNILEGIIRLALFLAYIYLIGLMPDIRRVFAYHGAEHKTIAADEAGAPLVPETIQQYSKAHPRCGTGFLLVVVVVSIFVFALLGRPPMEWRIASRIVLIPVIAALSYELIKFASAHKSNPLLNYLVVQPSLALQSLTTREPDAQMIEVAVVALQTVKQKEKGD
ncbi:MAG: DUF1385 domain-containing protein [Anaerolineae bacterium]|nr:DUF1385 domain-containing protein [Anaerolineae bacterium]